MVVNWQFFRTEVKETLSLGRHHWLSFTESLVGDSFSPPYVLVPGGRIARRALQNFGQMCVGLGDSNEARWGTEIDGFKIESFERLTQKYPQATFVVCSAVFGFEIEKQ